MFGWLVAFPSAGGPVARTSVVTAPCPVWLCWSGWEESDWLGFWCSLRSPCGLPAPSMNAESSECHSWDVGHHSCHCFYPVPKSFGVELRDLGLAVGLCQVFAFPGGIICLLTMGRFPGGRGIPLPHPWCCGVSNGSSSKLGWTGFCRGVKVLGGSQS